MEEGGLALSFTRQSFFYFHRRGNLAAHDFLKVGCAFAGEFDFFGDLSGGHIIAIFDQGIMFFLQSHDVHIVERLELFDHLEVDIGLFLEVFLQVFLRFAEACQMGIDHIGNPTSVLFAFIGKVCEVLFDDILHIAAWDVADRALEGAC